MKQICLIYGRVSSQKQVQEGTGLDSQVRRCAMYAAASEYQVCGVFKDEGVSGGASERPGTTRLFTELGKLHKQHGEEIVVLVDDLKRWARDVDVHRDFKRKVESLGGRLESVSNGNLGGGAIGKFVELILAGTAELERVMNQEQVVNRMTACLQAGRWVFAKPPGYKYVAHPVHKKILVRDEPLATHLGEALTGLATGRFASRREAIKYLQAVGAYPSDRNFSTSMLESRFNRLLRMLPLVAGMVGYETWGVPWQPGIHEPIITMDTYEALKEWSLAPEGEIKPHRFVNNDSPFWLRGFLKCEKCGRPLTASATKGGSVMRYQCYHKTCERYGLNMNLKTVHKEFEGFLAGLECDDATIELFRELIKERWEGRVKAWVDEVAALKRKAAAWDEQSRSMLQGIGAVADNAEMLTKLKGEIESVDSKRKAALARVKKLERVSKDFDSAFRVVGTMLKSPLQIWNTGDLPTKKLLLTFVFSSSPTYWRETGLGTVNLTLPYLVSQQIVDSKGKLVEVAGISPASSVPQITILHAQMHEVRLSYQAHRLKVAGATLS